MAKPKKRSKFVGLFTNNAGLKLASLVLAMILWYLVRTGFLQ